MQGLNSGRKPVVGPEPKPTTPESEPNMTLKTAAQARAIVSANQNARNTEALERATKAIDAAVEKVQFACTVSDLPLEVVQILTKAPYLYTVGICTDPKDQSTTATISW